MGLVISSLLTILVEITLRCFLPFPLTSITTYQAFSDVIYFHKPNSKGYEVSPLREFRPVRLCYNRYGFRGNFKFLPNDKQLIILLGDFFIEGRQVDFESTITELLNRSYQNKFFINAGCSGYTTTTEFLLLKYRLLKLKPTKVLLFFLFNDYCDNYWYNGGYYKQKDIFFRLLDKRYIPQVYKNFYKKIDNLLSIKSIIYAYYKQILKPPFKLRVGKQVAEGKKIYNSPRQINKPLGKMDKLEKEILNFTHQGILEMSKLCKENNIEFIVFIIPLPLQVNKNEWQIGKLVFGYKKEDIVKETLYQKRLLNLYKKNNIKCIDLLPYFKRKSNRQKIYHNYDGHFTKYGHKVIAQVIKEKVFPVSCH